ncbi:hypothetical protein [Rhizobium straminoryzae]|uniref:DUF1515 domain-containing protein n=1 Tax=Rhizobium straminoryzae TaxID=1387186 RepID=A0A549TD14_9HYPH|nr:hypothetical protein [Rhizobium straminoryzae]TRL39816.1 hypothetical protein FNA46_07725 [Rhizobium straminoryzae]
MDGTQIILRQLEMMNRRLDTIDEAGSERGRRIWEKLNAQDTQIALLAHRFASLEESVSGQALTLSQYQDLRKKAEGAGWLGQKLLLLGSFVLGAAGWIYGSWSTIAGAIKWAIGKVP